MGSKLSRKSDKTSRNEEDESSLITVTINGKKFKTPITVLVQNSEYFRAAMEFGGVEAVNNEIELDSGLITSKAYKKVLKYFLLNRIQLVFNDEIGPIVEAASYLMADDLLDKCLKFCIRISDKDLSKVRELLDIAAEHPVPALTKIVMSRVISNFDAFYNPQSVGALPLLAVEGLLESTTVRVRSEHTILEVVRNWIQGERARIALAPKLFSLLNFKQLSLENALFPNRVRMHPDVEEIYHKTQRDHAQNIAQAVVDDREYYGGIYIFTKQGNYSKTSAQRGAGTKSLQFDQFRQVINSQLACCGGKVYFIGGKDRNTLQSSARVICFDPSTATTKEVASMNYPRMDFQVHSQNGKIYVASGKVMPMCRFITCRYVEVYSPDKDKWEILTPTTMGHPENQFRFLQVFGRVDGVEESDAVQAIHPAPSPTGEIHGHHLYSFRKRWSKFGGVVTHFPMDRPYASGSFVLWSGGCREHRFIHWYDRQTHERGIFAISNAEEVRDLITPFDPKFPFVYQGKYLIIPYAERTLHARNNLVKKFRIALFDDLLQNIKRADFSFLQVSREVEWHGDDIKREDVLGFAVI